MPSADDELMKPDFGHVTSCLYCLRPAIALIGPAINARHDIVASVRLRRRKSASTPSMPIGEPSNIENRLPRRLPGHR